MKYQLLSSSLALGATFALWGCGDGDECRVVSNDDGSATILCTDGSTTEIPRPASGKPPETCSVVDIGDDRFVRCGDIDYPIGSTSPLCPTGYFEGDITLTLEESSGLDEFELSGCKKLNGRLVIDGGRPSDDPRGLPDAGPMDIPTSILNLQEVKGDIFIDFLVGGSQQSFASLVKVEPQGMMTETRGSLSMFSSTLETATMFPALEVASEIEVSMGASASLEFPSLRGSTRQYSDQPEIIPVRVRAIDSGIQTFKFPVVEFFDLTIEGDLLRELVIPRLQSGTLNFGMESSGVLTLPSSPAEDVWGQIWFTEMGDWSAWEAILPNVNFDLYD